MQSVISKKVRNYLNYSGKRRRFEGIHDKFADFSMIPREAYIANLFIVDGSSRCQGCVVECGTWRGGMIAGIAELLGPERRYYLFDSFEGLPPAKEIDGPGALAYTANAHAPGNYDNCTAEVEFAQKAMALSGVKNYEIIKGWFDKTLPNFVPPEPIAILRLDADWYESTMACLEGLYKHLADTAIIIIIDDYYTWDGCARAVHQFLAQTQSTARLTSHGGISVLRKK
jgi:O-methyltransferase